ncbi:MAG: response regulator [candidate division NC10 bacterium]|nr:response regulator [candidate division NC10 bacterium]
MAGEKVLVVDDEPLIAQMLTDRLQELYVDVIRASNGVEALERAWEHVPDLILLDVMMPKIDGFEVAKILKENPRTASIPIIFLTALSQVKDKVRGLQLGAEDYVTKPFHFDELLVRVRKVLRKSEAEKSEKGGGGLAAVKGKLRDMSLVNLIQFLELEKKTGVLSIVSESRSGHLYFQEGKIVNAVQGTLRGEGAVYRLLNWTDGDFELESLGTTPPSGPARITMGNQTLIMEGLRRLDETARLAKNLPPLSTRLKVSPRLRQVLADKKLAPDLERFLRLFDGNRDIQAVIEESGLDELKALENVHKLYSKGMLETA